MLLLICEYMRRVKMASDQQLAREFNSDVLAMKPMLQFWLNKGVLALCQEADACKSRCFKCRNLPIYYQFIDGKDIAKIKK